MKTPPMKHELKCWPQFFDHCVSGFKSFEIRQDDRGGFKTLDRLNLKEWNPETKEYSGLEKEFTVTYVLREHEGLKEGFCIMGIRPMPSIDKQFAAMMALSKSADMDDEMAKLTNGELCDRLVNDVQAHMPWLGLSYALMEEAIKRLAGQTNSVSPA